MANLYRYENLKNLNFNHLKDEQLLPEITECPTCGSSHRKNELLLQQNPDIIVYRCLNCCISYASRFPGAEVLNELHEKYYEFNDSLVGHDDSQILANHIFKSIKSTFSYKNELKILDFGGGGGDVSIKLSQYLLNNNFAEEITIVLVDPSGVQSIYDNSHIKFCTYKDIDDLNTTNKFDIVIASAVLEHIPDTKSVLKKLLNFMQNGAYLYIRTPYILPTIKFLGFLGVKVDFNYPDHIYDMGEEFWKKLFEIIFPNLHNGYKILLSRPSLVETSFKKHFVKALISHLFKLPYKIFGKRYKLVGGWEIVIKKR